MAVTKKELLDKLKTTSPAENELLAIIQEANADEEVLKSTVQATNCTEAVLVEIAKHPKMNKDVLILVLSHPKCKDDASEQVFTNNTSAVLTQLNINDKINIANQAKTFAVLNYLLGSKKIDNRLEMAIIKNPKVKNPMDIRLVNIAKRTDSPDVLTEIVELSLYDENIDTAIIRNPKTKDSDLEKIAKNTKHTSILKKLVKLGYKTDTLDQAIVNNPKTAPEDLEKIAAWTKNEDTLMAMAKRPGVIDNKVALNIINNPAIKTTKVLQELLNHVNDVPTRTLISQKAIPLSSHKELEEIAKNTEDADTLKQIVGLGHKADAIDAAIAANSKTVSEDLEKIALRTTNKDILKTIVFKRNLKNEKMYTQIATLGGTDDLLELAANNTRNSDTLKRIVGLGFKNNGIDTAIANNNNTLVSDLIELANRTTNPYLLEKIALPPTKQDINIDKAIVANNAATSKALAHIASKATTNEVLLHNIVNHTTKSPEIDQSVVNRKLPNTAVNDLITIVKRTKDTNLLHAIVEHPAKDLIIDKEIAAKDETSVNDLATIAQKVTTDNILLHTIVEHKNKDLKIDTAVVHNNKTDIADLAKIATRTTDANLLNSIVTLPGKQHNSIDTAVVDNPYTSANALKTIAARTPALLPKIAAHKNADALLADIANNLVTPMDVLKTIAEKTNTYDALIAKHANTDLDTLKKIASRTQDSAVLANLAQHHRADIDLLKIILKKDARPQFVDAILTAVINKNIALGNDETVYLAAANNPLATEAHLNSIRQHTHDSKVLTAIVSQPKASNAILKAILEHNDRELNEDILKIMGGHGNIESDTLTMVANKNETKFANNEGIYISVVKNEKTKTEVLTKIAGTTTNINLLIDIANHKHTDGGTLQLVINANTGDDINVYKAVARNMNALTPALMQIANKTSDIGVLTEIVANRGVGANDEDLKKFVQSKLPSLTPQQQQQQQQQQRIQETVKKVEGGKKKGAF